jgi:glutathione S-transferase
VIDGHVQTPMQKIVLDNLRPEGASDPHGVEEARGKLDRIYPVLDGQLRGRDWLAGPAFTLADCAAAPALHYARAVRRWDEAGLTELTRYYEALTARPSVSRVIDEARPFREFFPLAWPDYVG